MAWDDNDMHQLRGRRVLALRVAGDESALVFETDLGRWTYVADGDCCSETWFADITGVASLLGHVVTATEAVDLPEVDDGRTRQEYDKFYGVKLTTDVGYVDIVYRNSSNGYYGGSIDYWAKYEVPDGQLAQITGDWQAGK